MTKRLTKRQAGVFVYICDYITENKYPPTVREIADAFDIKSTNGVVEHLKALARKGFIEKDDFRSRSLRPLVDREEGLSILEGRTTEAPTRGRIASRSGGNSKFDQPKPEPHKQLKVLGRIACGAPIFAEENFEEALDIDPSIFCRGEDDVYALRVRGTSMIGDGIMPGDIVVVRSQQTAEDGELVAAMLDGSATVKRYEKRKGVIYLIPSNPAMDPITISPEDNIDFQILGSIRGVLRVYR